MLRTLFSSKGQPVAKGAHIYFSRRGVIVVALHQNSSGILFEQTEVTSIEGIPDALQLGTAFREAFERFSIKDANLSKAKKTEWPAFIASKLHSVKDFENSYRLMSCMSLNSSNSVVRAAMTHPDEECIEIALSFNPLLPHLAIGEHLLRLAKVADVKKP